MKRSHPARDAWRQAEMAVDYSTRDGVAVLTLNNPPVNGRPVDPSGRHGRARSRRAGPVGHGHRADRRGTRILGGADITEFNTPKALQEPTLHTVIRAVETSAKPVVAALLRRDGRRPRARARRARIAAPGTQVALPEVKLGLLPGAGGAAPAACGGRNRAEHDRRARPCCRSNWRRAGCSMKWPTATCSTRPSRSPARSARRRAASARARSQDRP